MELKILDQRWDIAFYVLLRDSLIERFFGMKQEINMAGGYLKIIIPQLFLQYISLSKTDMVKLSQLCQGLWNFTFQYIQCKYITVKLSHWVARSRPFHPVIKGLSETNYTVCCILKHHTWVTSSHSVRNQNGIGLGEWTEYLHMVW